MNAQNLKISNWVLITLGSNQYFFTHYSMVEGFGGVFVNAVVLAIKIYMLVAPAPKQSLHKTLDLPLIFELKKE